MKSIIDKINKLKVNDKIYLFDKGEVKVYRFLSTYQNNKYIILLDICQEPVKFFIDSSYPENNFYIDCTIEDVLEYKKSYYLRKLQETEEEIKNNIKKKNNNVKK